MRTIAPSPYQEAIYRAVSETRDNLAIIARAGSGKTTTLLEIARRLPRDARNLLCAFNVVIAAELRRRAPEIEARTLHSLGLEALRHQWGINDLHPSSHREKAVLAAHLPSWLDPKDATTVLGIVRFAKADLAESDVALKLIADTHRLWINWEPYEEANHVKRGQGDKALFAWARKVLAAFREPSSEITYDDMVYVPAWHSAPMGRFDNVLVDESQDLTRAQGRLVELLGGKGTRVIVVGDPKQAIYAFRGADFRSIDRLVERFDCRILSLPVTYRCARAIVRLANEIVPDLEARPDAPEGLVRDAPSSVMLAEWRPGDMVVSRTNAPLVGFCLRAILQGVPSYIIGKDLGASLLSLLRQSKAETLQDFLQWLWQWSEAEGTKLHEKHKDDQAETVLDKVNTLVALCEGLRTLKQLKDRVGLLFADDPGTRLAFATTHRAKGLEAERVWMLEDTYRLGLSTEENNLWYVAVTRAKTELVRVYK